MERDRAIELRNALDNRRPMHLLRRLGLFRSGGPGLLEILELKKHEKLGSYGRTAAAACQAFSYTSGINRILKSGDRSRAFKHGIGKGNWMVTHRDKQRRATLPIDIEPDSAQASLLNYLFMSKGRDPVFAADNNLRKEVGLFYPDGRSEYDEWPSGKDLSKSGIGLYVKDGEQIHATVIYEASFKALSEEKQNAAEDLVSAIKENAIYVSDDMHKNSQKPIINRVPPTLPIG